MKTQTATKRLNDILNSLGTLARTCSDIRHCSRCGLELTDCASIERGQGPICARKDTHLYAKTIQVNWSMVTAFATMVINENSFPTETTVRVWVALRDVLVDMSGAAHQRALADNGTGEISSFLSGDDCRLTVKVLDWLLSFKLPPDTRRNLIQLVRHLGYIALAGVLSGEASTGESTLKFENGRVILSGSSNKAGYAAMRKNVRGVFLPARRGPSVFSAPATSAAAFIDVATEFWPCFDAKAQDVLAQANKWAAEHVPVSAPVAASVVTDSRPVATITKRSTDFLMSFEWTDHSRSIIERLKQAIPAKHRAYDAAKRQWIIRDMSYEPTLRTLLSQNNYRVDMQDGGATPAPPRYAYYNHYRR